MTTQSSLGRGSGTSTRPALRSPRIAAFFTVSSSWGYSRGRRAGLTTPPGRPRGRCLSVSGLHEHLWIPLQEADEVVRLDTVLQPEVVERLLQRVLRYAS